MGFRFVAPLLLLIGIFTALAEPVPATPPDLDDLWELEEDFLFEVRYGFFKLGTVEVEVHRRDTVYNGKKARQFTNIIKSNPSVPFVGYREVHYHTMLTRNDTIPYGLKFWSDNYHDEIMEEVLYEYDYENGVVTYYEEGEKIKEMELDEPADGGPAVFYYSRLHAGASRDVRYPIYIGEEKGFVYINNRNEVKSYDSKAFDGEVEAYHSTGKANFEGPFGFSGDFEAIFKADELRIPLEARVQVWVGSVRVRLVEYERHN